MGQAGGGEAKLKSAGNCLCLSYPPFIRYIQRGYTCLENKKQNNTPYFKIKRLLFPARTHEKTSASF